MSINWNNIQPAIQAGNPKATTCGDLPALKLRFVVPLSHSDQSDTRTLTLQAELVYHPNVDAGSNPETTLKTIINAPTPLAVYLCGGPGANNPSSGNPTLNTLLLDKFPGILFLDYRATGQSSPLTASTPQTLNLTTPVAIADYLTHFRQDSIAADLEAIRLCLSNLFRDSEKGELSLMLLGQSFGGWIALTYLSFLPRGLDAVYTTGGMPPVGKTPEEVYTALYVRLVRANEEYYEEYPGDAAAVRRVVAFLAGMGGGRGLRLRDGQWLSARGFLTMGRHFGKGEDGRREVHELVEMFDADVRGVGEISERAMKTYYDLGGAGFKFPERPLYAVLHEPIYCSGPGVVSNWAAQRVGRQLAGGHFSWLDDDFVFDFPDSGNCEELYFSGEMTHEFMLRDAGPELEPFIEAGRLLAEKNDWSDLYDEEQLRRNEVPLRCMVYPEDMFVDFNFSMEAADRIGNCRAVPVPDDWTHKSIRTRTKEVFERLFDAE